MRRRPSSLFRGSELPRLMFLVAIVMAGWSYVLFARPQVANEPPPPTVSVEKLTPVVPDDGVEFLALIDKAPIQTRESAAYATLLERVRKTSAEELDKKARRDIFYTNLWENPKHYRGVPVHLVGTAKKILTHEVSPAMSPNRRLYEVWFYSDENRAFPYVVTIEDPPTGLVIGHELNLRVTVDGYFMKILGYRAGDTLRGAPMLVGRIHWIKTAPQSSSKLFEWNLLSRRDLLIIFLMVLACYIVFRVVFQVRKTRSSIVANESFSSKSVGLPPDAVAEWLENLPHENRPDDDDHHQQGS